MFVRKQQPKVLCSLITLLSLSLLASCGNSEALESFVNADPQLRVEENLEDSASDSNVNNSQNNQETTTQTADEPLDSESDSLPSSDPEVIAANNLPAEIPEEIPLYPQAQLEQMKPDSTAESGSLTLRSPDNLIAIADYYQTQLQSEEWSISQPFSSESDGNSQSAIASKNNLKIKISLADLSVNSEDNGSQTEINIAYKASSPNVTTTNPENSEVAPNVSPRSPNDPEVTSNSVPVTTTATNFTDLGEVREQLQPAVKEVAALGILTPRTKDSLDKFTPNELVTRRDYARWLVSANNKYHNDSPGKKIHLTKKSDQIAFKDIDANDPDFGAIQGLAEAGLIPSILTNDSNNVLFRPDAVLTREDLVTWKAPLDLRGALAKASIETIRETWGFQDAAKIDPLAIRALFSDYQNGDRANVRRVFGYTTLFRPKKGVTRAEAAASLWYFGYQNDGISAKEILSLSE